MEGLKGKKMKKKKSKIEKIAKSLRKKGYSILKYEVDTSFIVNGEPVIKFTICKSKLLQL